MPNDIQQPTTALATGGRQDLAGFFAKSLAPQLAVALPRHLTPDRMTRVCLTAIRTVKNLDKCTPASFAGEIMKLAQLGLEPNTPLGHAYLIPRQNKGAWECTSILGYQGYLELARRSGSVKSIYAHVVRKGDEFEYELGLHKKLVHRPKAGPEAPTTHVYCVAHVEGAEPIFEVLTFAEVERRRKIGASGRGTSTPWDAHPEAMAKKSAVRALWPWLPKSAEMAAAVELDADERPVFDSITSRASASAVDALNAAITGGSSEPAAYIEAGDDEPTADELASAERVAS
jgi:recombination protein RecT